MEVNLMGKNNRLINSINKLARRKQEEDVGKAADQMVPQIYAAIALDLYRTCGFDYEQINSVFVESQCIWEDFVGAGEEMIELCEKETGISVVGRSLNET